MGHWTQARELGFEPGKQTDLSTRIKKMYSEHFINDHSGEEVEEEEEEEEAKEVSHTTSSPAASAAPDLEDFQV